MGDLNLYINKEQESSGNLIPKNQKTRGAGRGREKDGLLKSLY